MSERKHSVTDGLVVGIHFTLRNEAGETLDSSEGQDPLEYLHGAGNIVPGLEDALAGLELGDSFQVTVQPEDGYGDRDPRGIRDVRRDAFPDDATIEPGMQFFTEGPDGEPLAAWVLEVADERVVVDLNHPLAGVTLQFEGTIDSLREASAEELEHGHPHGPGGHEH